MFKKFNSDQEMCDYAVKAMVAQGGQSISDNACLYSTSCGTKKCAVGHILTEETLTKIPAGFVGSVGALAWELGEELDRRSLLLTLQNYHDNNCYEAFPSIRQCLQENYNIDTSGAHWDAWDALRKEQILEEEI